MVKFRQIRKVLGTPFKDFYWVIRILLATLIFGCIVSLTAFIIIKFPNTSFKTNEVSIYIHSNDDYQQLLINLKPYLKSTKTFELTSKVMKFRVNAGRFIISKGMNNYDIIKTFRGMSRPVKVTFNNVENIMTLAGQIEKYIEADSLSLIKAFLDKDFLFKTGFDKQSALAMYIPNTYQLFWNTSAEKFRTRMLAEYNHFWNRTRMNKLNAIKISKIDAITLSSIVQKESNQQREYSTLAGVYINRLRKNMRLQADPTVIYGLKEKTNNFNLVIKRVLYKDLKVDSPYNTYIYKGLPPGPIITPNIPVIDAVLNYKKHNYIFFTADMDNSGYLTFARTLREHRRNKRKYVKWLNKMKIYR